MINYNFKFYTSYQRKGKKETLVRFLNLIDIIVFTVISLVTTIGISIQFYRSKYQSIYDPKKKFCLYDHGKNGL